MVSCGQKSRCWSYPLRYKAYCSSPPVYQTPHQNDKAYDPGAGRRGGGWDTLIFACYKGSTFFFFLFKILNFAIFFCVEVLSTIFMGMPILAGIFFFWGGGMPFSTAIFSGVSLKTWILCCFFLFFVVVFCCCFFNIK